MSASPTYKPRLNVSFLNADITTVTVDAVVTGEDPDLRHERFVTRTLMNAFPEFRDKRDELKRKAPKGLGFGKVLPSYLGPPQNAENKRNFQYVFHAALENTIKKESSQSIIRDLEYLYGNIFEAAETLKLTSVALPLIGSGAAGTDAEPVIEALTRSIVNTKLFYLTDLLVVCTDEGLLAAARRQLSNEGQGNDSFKRLVTIDGQSIDSMETQANKTDIRSLSLHENEHCFDLNNLNI